MRYRRRDNATAGLPVVLPQIIVHPAGTADDTYTISFNGDVAYEQPVSRAELGRAVASLAEKTGTPVRVEVHDPDGGVYADIIHPPPRDHAQLPRSSQDARDSEFTVDYTGFLPGERVLVAIVDRVDTADQRGVITLRVDQTLAGACDVVLFGSVSGTTILGGLQ